MYLWIISNININVLTNIYNFLVFFQNLNFLWMSTWRFMGLIILNLTLCHHQKGFVVIWENQDSVLCNSTQKNDVRNQYSWTSLSLHKITSVVTNKNNANVAYNSLARQKDEESKHKKIIKTLLNLTEKTFWELL